MRDEDFDRDVRRQDLIDAIPDEEWQRRVDAHEYDIDQYRAKKTVVGSALKDAEKVQKFYRTDPWPAVPFSDEELDYKLPLWMKLAYGAVVVGVIAWVVL